MSIHFFKQPAGCRRSYAGISQAVKILPVPDGTTVEELNAIFRCAHSIKGGAATFGFEDVAEMTHQMESLLDKLRRHELQPTPPMVDVLLESSDALKVLLARHQGRPMDPPETASLVERIYALANGQAPAAAAPAPTPAPASAAQATGLGCSPAAPETAPRPAAIWPQRCPP